MAFLENKEKEKEDNKITMKSKDDKNKLNDTLNKLIEILEKAQNEINKEIKREVLDKLKRNMNMEKLAKILDEYYKKRLEKNKNEEIKDNNENKDNFLKNNEKENTFKQILLISKQYEEEIQEEKEDKENKENNNTTENEKPEDKLDEKNFKIIQKKNILFTMKKEEKTEPDTKKSSTKKRIAYRRSPIKNKNTNKKKLKKALDKWKKNSSLMNKDIYDKYKRKVLQDLIKVYHKGEELILKKYFDEWKNKENEESKEDNVDDEEILKYKKKPRMEYKSDFIEEYEQETIKDNDTFKPIYILPKENLHTIIIDNPFIDESIHEPMNSNINTEKVIPYVKKYGQRNYNNKSKNSNYKNDKEINGLYQNNIFPKNKNEKEHSSDNSSEESSYLSGITLIQNNKEIKFQSYFIDKPLQNSHSNNNYTKTDIYKINQIPNMMKGDFGNFLENNPKIFRKKNPRIQITRSTCDLNNLMDNPNINNDLILDNFISLLF